MRVIRMSELPRLPNKGMMRDPSKIGALIAAARAHPMRVGQHESQGADPAGEETRGGSRQVDTGGPGQLHAGTRCNFVLVSERPAAVMVSWA